MSDSRFHSLPWFHFSDDISVGKELSLNSDQAHHASRVLRLKEGDSLVLVDGLGHVAIAHITKLGRGELTTLVDELTELGKPSQIHLVFGVTKGPSLDFIIRKCTEVGVASFQPLVTQHSLSVSSWNDARWDRVVQEVGKQCQSAFFPPVHNPVRLTDWIKDRKPLPLVLCSETTRTASLSSLPSSPVHLLVGAEGGWSQEELAMLNSLGASHLGLGSHRLRAETASLVALTLLKQALGEFRR